MNIAKEIEKATGLRYDGVWEGLGLTFTDIEQTGSTFTANSVKEARDKLAIMRFKFLIGDIEMDTIRLHRAKEMLTVRFMTREKIDNWALPLVKELKIKDSIGGI